jgi:acetyltransferase-like isoleucine patch superfamily enzyme
MHLFFQNPENKLLKEREFEITSEYSLTVRCLLVLLWLLFLPLSLLFATIGKILVSTFMISGQMAFHMTEKIIGKHKNTRHDYVFQGVRAYINNCLATSVPHINSSFRRFLFRLTGITIGRGGFIGMNGYMEDLAPQNVIIEDGVTCSFNVSFIAHGVKEGKSQDEKYIILRKGCYIGARSTILPGVEIGSQAVIGAGSVVTKNVPPGAIVAGCPAKILKWQEGYGPEEVKE